MRSKQISKKPKTHCTGQRLLGNIHHRDGLQIPVGGVHSFWGVLQVPAPESRAERKCEAEIPIPESIPCIFLLKNLIFLRSMFFIWGPSCTRRPPFDIMANRHRPFWGPTQKRGPTSVFAKIPPWSNYLRFLHQRERERELGEERERINRDVNTKT